MVRAILKKVSRSKTKKGSTKPRKNTTRKKKVSSSKRKRGSSGKRKKVSGRKKKNSRKKLKTMKGGTLEKLKISLEELRKIKLGDKVTIVQNMELYRNQIILITQNITTDTIYSEIIKLINDEITQLFDRYMETDYANLDDVMTLIIDAKNNLQALIQTEIDKAEAPDADGGGGGDGASV